MTTQKGLIVTCGAMHEEIAQHCARAYSVTSWQNDRSPATQRALYDLVKRLGYAAESVFDAAHGRRYMLFIYSTREGRKACWDHLTGAIK